MGCLTLASLLRRLTDYNARCISPGTTPTPRKSSVAQLPPRPRTRFSSPLKPLPSASPPYRHAVHAPERTAPDALIPDIAKYGNHPAKQTRPVTLSHHDRSRHIPHPQDEPAPNPVHEALHQCRTVNDDAASGIAPASIAMHARTHTPSA